jgi:hypothetical protein
MEANIVDAKEEIKRLSQALKPLEELQGSDYLFISNATKVMCTWIKGMLEQLEPLAQVRRPRQLRKSPRRPRGIPDPKVP